MTWDISTNGFKLTENKVRKFCCAILHAMVFAYNIIVLLDHIHNFNGILRSIISECFVLFSDFPGAVLGILFAKIVWFDKHQLEYIIDSLTSNIFNGKQLALIKSTIFIMAAISVYYAYDYSYTDLAFLSEAKENQSYFKYTTLVTLWVSKYYVLRKAQLHVLLFYFIEVSFIFALNCSILETAWNIRKELIAIGNHNVEKVFTLSLIQT